MVRYKILRWRYGDDFYRIILRDIEIIVNLLRHQQTHGNWMLLDEINEQAKAGPEKDPYDSDPNKWLDKYRG